MTQNLKTIIERLRSPEFADVAEKYLMAEAANEIERLRAALQHIANLPGWAGRHRELARAALGGKDD